MDFSKLIPKLCVVSLLICMNFQHVKLESNRNGWNSLDFNQIKNDLFLKSEFRMLNPNDFLNSKTLPCLKEISDIKKGLENYEQWAIKCKVHSFIQSEILSTNWFLFFIQWLIRGANCRQQWTVAIFMNWVVFRNVLTFQKIARHSKLNTVWANWSSILELLHQKPIKCKFLIQSQFFFRICVKFFSINELTQTNRYTTNNFWTVRAGRLHGRNVGTTDKSIDSGKIAIVQYGQGIRETSCKHLSIWRKCQQIENNRQIRNVSARYIKCSMEHSRGEGEIIEKNILSLVQCDFISSGFFGVIFCLILASTSYDILCTMTNCEFPYHQSYHLIDYYGW